MPVKATLSSLSLSTREWIPDGVRVVLFSKDSIVQRSTPFLAAFGGIALTYLSAKVLYCTGKALISYVLARPLKLGAALQKGDWAVITGGSDGIGKEFAHELAHKGLNIVLVARNIDKLEGVAREITTKYSVQTKIIAIDLGKMGPHNIPQMQEELKDLSVAVLVNSAAAFGEFGGTFLGNPVSDEQVANIVNLNARALVMMIRAVMPMMLLKKPEARRYIINVGAILGGARPSAGTALYGATKAFNDSFSQALHREYCGQGIFVQSYIPGPTRTKALMTTVGDGYKIFTISAEDTVSSALSQLGFRSRTYGHWKHALLASLLRLRGVIEIPSKA